MNLLVKNHLLGIPNSLKRDLKYTQIDFFEKESKKGTQKVVYTHTGVKCSCIRIQNIIYNLMITLNNKKCFIRLKNFNLGISELKNVK